MSVSRGVGVEGVGPENKVSHRRVDTFDTFFNMGVGRQTREKHRGGRSDHERPQSGSSSQRVLPRLMSYSLQRYTSAIDETTYGDEKMHKH